ncbi:efflux RND transporter permease subunit [bacterium]|nr:efflux RND transporter permease subunit [bacterium]
MGISGSVASVFTNPSSGNQYNMLVRLSEDYRNKQEDIKNLTVQNSDGRLIKLGDIVQVVRFYVPDPVVYSDAVHDL